MSATTTTTTSTVDAHPGRFWPDMIVITRRNLLRNVRLPQLLLFATIQPVMFLLLFTYVFGGAIGGSIPDAAGGEYINYLLPGLMVQIATFGAGQTAVGLSEDLGKGVIDRFRSLPMSRSAVLAGRTLSDLLRNAFVTTLMLAVAFLVGFRYQTSFGQLVLALLVVLAFTYAFSWIMALLGLAISSPEAVQSATFLPVFPLVFASSIFVPTSTLPDWLQPFAANQPVSVVADAMRGLILGPTVLTNGNSVLAQAMLALAWSAAIVAVFAPLAVRKYRRVTS
jgi:ABC transporter DrrB family efflux protein